MHLYHRPLSILTWDCVKFLEDYLHFQPRHDFNFLDVNLNLKLKLAFKIQNSIFKS